MAAKVARPRTAGPLQSDFGDRVRGGSHLLNITHTTYALGSEQSTAPPMSIHRGLQIEGAAELLGYILVPLGVQHGLPSGISNKAALLHTIASQTCTPQRGANAAAAPNFDPDDRVVTLGIAAGSMNVHRRTRLRQAKTTFQVLRYPVSLGGALIREPLP